MQLMECKVLCLIFVILYFYKVTFIIILLGFDMHWDQEGGGAGIIDPLLFFRWKILVMKLQGGFILVLSSQKTKLKNLTT